MRTPGRCGALRVHRHSRERSTALHCPCAGITPWYHRAMRNAVAMPAWHACMHAWLVQAEDGSALLKEEPHVEFTGEEGLGRYLDLHDLFLRFHNSKLGGKQQVCGCGMRVCAARGLSAAVRASLGCCFGAALVLHALGTACACGGGGSRHTR